MPQSRMKIGHIPCIIWGAPSDRVYIHVHGKHSRKEYAEGFARIAEAKGYQTLSFDLPEHGERTGSDRCDVWNGIRDLRLIADFAFSNWKQVSLFACSLGAYFSLQAYADLPFQKCLFQSPIADMAYLVGQMMTWFSVTEAALEAAGEIETPIDPLRWDYYQYIIHHPTDRWTIPTGILYGERDELQSREGMEAFARRHGCHLTVAPNCTHAFMEPGEPERVENWLKENI